MNTTRVNVPWYLMTIGSALVVLLSLKYFSFDPEVYFTHQRYLYEAHVVGLMLHIGGMVVALAMGPFQFLSSLRTRRPSVHRLMGKLYMAGTLVGGLAGFYMAMYSRAGVYSAVGFGLLAVGVLVTTGRAYVLIRARHIDEHQEWMTRSFALIFAAVTLRIYAPLLQTWFSESTTFAIVAWACWIPNLLIAQWLIKRQSLSKLEPDLVAA